MKKSFLGFLAVSAVLVSGAAHAQIDLVNSGGFEGYALGNVSGQFGWTSAISVGGNQPDIVEFGGSKVLRLSSPAPTGNERRRSQANANWGPVNANDYPKVTVSFSIYIPSTNFQNVYFGQGTSDNNFNQTINDGRWFRAFQDSPNRTANGSFPVDAWVPVVMVWDKANNIRTSSINGVVVDAAHTYASMEPWTSFNIRTITDNRPGGPGSIAYIDDFKVEAVPEPGTIAAVVTGLAGIAAMRRRRA